MRAVPVRTVPASPDAEIDGFIWGLFYQKFVQPIVWGEPGDQARIEKTLADDLPRELDYLEGLWPFEQVQIGASPQGRRQALLAAGAPLTEATLGTRGPRRGFMAL